MRIHLIANSHIDPAWTWDKYEGIDEVINTFRAACDRLDEYPDVCFSATSLQFYEWVYEIDKHLFARIRKHVRSGAWEVVGGWWVEGDTNLPRLSSMLQQAEVSRQFAKKHLGVDVKVAYMPDTFGHPATLPLILKETGFRYFIFCRPARGEKDDLPGDLFYWKYGSAKVLTYRVKHFYGNSAGWTPDQFKAKLDDAEYTPDKVNCVICGMGDHGGAVTIAEIEFSKKYMEGHPAGDTAFSTLHKFFADAEKQKKIPTYEGDLHMHAVGCYSAVRTIKAGVREAEHALEFTSRALRMADKNAASLAPLWKTLLFNQFHDVLPGSCVRTTAQQALDELGGVASQARDISYSALKTVSTRRKVTFKEGEFRAFNTLPHPVTVPLAIESLTYFKPGAVMKDEKGRIIHYQEVLPRSRAFTHRWEFVDTLPSQGCKSYHMDGGHFIPSVVDVPFPHFEDGDRIAEGDRVVIGDGRIELSGTPLLASPIRFVLLDDASDLWGHGVRRFDAVKDDFNLISAHVLHGPITSKLHQRFACHKSTIDVVYSLYRGMPGIYLEVDVNWAEDRKILKMQIQPQGASSPVLTMEAAGGIVERKADGCELPLHQWAWVPAEKHSLAVIQNGAFACDCVNGRLNLTLVRSNIYSNHDPFKLMPGDVQYLTDQGSHSFRMVLLPHAKLDANALAKATAAFLEPYPIIRDGFQGP